jgi:hypothetical protein
LLRGFEYNGDTRHQQLDFRVPVIAFVIFVASEATSAGSTMSRSKEPQRKSREQTGDWTGSR